MDPLANIEEQRDLARAILATLDAADMQGVPPAVNDSAERLAELVLALDTWRRKGGHDPYEPLRS